MRAFVRFRCPDGSIAELAHGDLIGRLGTAALHLDDARISEAHAMISLRGEELKLLALRGRFAVGNKPLSGLTLAEGQRISFARGLTRCLLYTSPSPRDNRVSRMPSSA